MRRLLFFTFVSSLSAGLPAQSVPPLILSTDPFANSGSSTHQNIVRGPGGVLYALSVFDDGAGNRPLLLQFSVDGGQTWLPTGFTFNDATTGLVSPNPTNACTLAIDGAGVLHAMWGSDYYPSYFNHWYRNVDPVTLVASPAVNIQGITGVPVTSRTDAMAMAIDQADIVWIAAPAAASWQSQLLRSNLPSAGAAAGFTSAGTMSVSASSQGPDLVVDALGRIHCSYYRNTGNGEYEHRAYDPSTATWGAATRLGNTLVGNDYFGKLAADSLGYVHALYVMDATPTTTWLFRYRRLDPVTGWGPEVFLMDAPPTLHSGVAGYRIFALGCETATGRAVALWRDLSAGGGSLRIAAKGLADPGFALLSTLAPPTLGLHAYHVPTIRGSVWPPSNTAGPEIDLSWQWRPGASPPWSLIYSRFELRPPAVLVLNAPAAIGTTTTITLDSPSDPGRAYLCAFSGASTPGILLGDGRTVPLVPDLLFSLSLTPGNGVFLNTFGTLDTLGRSLVSVNVPFIPSAVGLTIFSAFVVEDSASPTLVGSISSALPITLQ